jgi:hypothetical protein
MCGYQKVRVLRLERCNDSQQYDSIGLSTGVHSAKSIKHSIFGTDIPADTQVLRKYILNAISICYFADVF